MSLEWTRRRPRAFPLLMAVAASVLVPVAPTLVASAAGPPALTSAPSKVEWTGGPLSGTAPVRREVGCAPTACTDFVVAVRPGTVPAALVVDVTATSGNTIALAIFAPDCSTATVPGCYKGFGPDDGLPHVRASFVQPMAGDWVIRVACGVCANASVHGVASLDRLADLLPQSTAGGARFDVQVLRQPAVPSGQNIGEPGVAVGPAGKVAVNSFGPALWTSTGSSGWSEANVSIDPSGCPSQDADAGIAADGTIYALNLCAGGLSALFLASTDGGKTWNSTTLGLPTPAAGDVDRPWIVTDPVAPATVYVEYHSAGAIAASDYGIYIVKSTNRGRTFGTPVAISAQDPSHLIDNTGGGNIVDRPLVDPTDHQRLYMAWVGTAATSGQASAPGYDPGFTRILLGTSSDGGQTWTTRQVLDDAPATVSHIRAVSAIDAAGNLYIVYSERQPGNPETHVLLRSSADRGARWSAPTRVDRGDTHSNVFPAITAGGPGSVMVSWEGSTSADFTDDGDLWALMFTRLANAQLGTPIFGPQTVVAMNHAGAICMVGFVGCERVNQLGSLYDFNGIAATPNGPAVLAWTNDLVDSAPQIMAARELPGPSGGPRAGSIATLPNTSPGLPKPWGLFPLLALLLTSCGLAAQGVFALRKITQTTPP